MTDRPWSTTVPDSRQPAGSPRVSLHDALPPGTRIDEFEILSVLGIGAFGIVYLADDHVLVRRVAIKEYMPAALAGRRDEAPISLRSAEFAATFERGLDSFLSEARLLASFDHPSLVKVHRFWRANGTAYMAMQYYPGATLKDVRLAMTAPPDEPWLQALVAPLLDALALLHGQGVFHRDISPDNIMILPGGRPVLLDFGSARRVIGTGSQFLSAVLKPPFAPVEQYAKESEMRQGPWTDLYALGATLWFALLGEAPTPSVVRAVDDTLPVLARHGDPRLAAMRGPLLATIDWMLAMAPDARPRDVETVRRALRGDIAVPLAVRQVAHVPLFDDVAPHEPFDDAGVDEDESSAASRAPDAKPASTAAGRRPAGDEAAAARAEQAPGEDDADAIADLPKRRPRLRRDARNAIVALALLGALVFAGGAWILNETRPATPDLASLAAALRAPVAPSSARATVDTPAPAATSLQVRTATPLPASAAPPLRAPAVPPAQPSASMTQPTTSVDPTTQIASASPAHALPATTVQQPLESVIERPLDVAAPTPVSEETSGERAQEQRPRTTRARVARASDAAPRAQVQTVASRARAASSRKPGSCDGLSPLAQMVCALRACKSPSMSASPKCVRGRQIEQARLRRMERE